MSVFVGLRLPEVLSARLDEESTARALNRSKTIIEILERSLMAPAERHAPSPATRAVAKLSPSVQPLVQPASAVPTPSARTKCPRCDAKLVPWGPQLRCESCRQNFPATI